MQGHLRLALNFTNLMQSESATALAAVQDRLYNSGLGGMPAMPVNPAAPFDPVDVQPAPGVEAAEAPAAAAASQPAVAAPASSTANQGPSVECLLVYICCSPPQVLRRSCLPLPGSCS